MNTRGERMRIEAVLKHLGTGADLREFPGTASEKVALVRTATHRGLVVWNRGRNRYELTSAGWCELAPNRRFGAGSMMLGTTVGATLGAAALAIFWFAAGTSHGARPGVAAAPAQQQVATVSRPAVGGALNSAGPLTQASAAAVPTATPAAVPPATPAATPVHEAAPVAAPPAAVAERTKVADEPTPEELEAAAKAKQVAAKKARQRAAARRQREEAARAWAADPRTQQAEYSGYGGHSAYRGYGGYGGQNSWFAYR
jgi:hypothetical protein